MSSKREGLDALIPSSPRSDTTRVTLAVIKADVFDDGDEQNVICVVENDGDGHEFTPIGYFFDDACAELFSSCVTAMANGAMRGIVTPDSGLTLSEAIDSMGED